MPYLIYDIELAKESGVNEDPVSVLRQLGCKNVEVVAGHESLEVVKLYVEETNLQLPPFITIDPEAPQKTITVFYKPPHKQYSR